MKNFRLSLRSSLPVLAVAAGLLSGPTVGAEEKYPSRPIEIIVPTGAGGGTDLVFRQLADLVGPILGTNVVVSNRPGGGGVIGTIAITRAKPDGYILGGLWNAPLTMTPHLNPVPYTPQDYLPISMADTSPTVLCTKKDFPANNGKEFIDYLKKNPNKFTYGNDGVGGTIQLTMERIFLPLGVKARAVPFSGAGETLKNFLGGHIDIYGGSMTTILPYVKDGSAKCLLVTSPRSVSSMPDAANLTELGVPDRSTLLWHGLIAPKGLPADRAALLEKAFQQAARSPQFREYMESRGITVEGSSSADFRKLIDSEYAAMGEVMAQIGLGKK